MIFLNGWGRKRLVPKVAATKVAVPKLWHRKVVDATTWLKVYQNSIHIELSDQWLQEISIAISIVCYNVEI